MRSWLRAQGFRAERHSLLLIPRRRRRHRWRGAGARRTRCRRRADLWTSAALPDRLPAGRYRFAGAAFSAVGATQLTLGWEYGSYRFTRYRSVRRARGCRRWSRRPAADLEYVRPASEALARRATSSIRPRTIWARASSARRCSASRCSTTPNAAIVVGEDLLRQNYPLIYEVGKGSAREPRLIDMRWGKTRRPQVTLVGKGVCFDTGGLDIKTVERHAAHEEGHGRRGAGAGAGAHAHGRRCAGAACAC